MGETRFNPVQMARSFPSRWSSFCTGPSGRKELGVFGASVAKV